MMTNKDFEHSMKKIYISLLCKYISNDCWSCQIIPPENVIDTNLPGVATRLAVFFSKVFLDPVALKMISKLPSLSSPLSDQTRYKWTIPCGTLRVIIWNYAQYDSLAYRSFDSAQSFFIFFYRYGTLYRTVAVSCTVLVPVPVPVLIILFSFFWKWSTRILFFKKKS